MKFCDECGAKLEDAAVFCDECGTKVESAITINDEKIENATVEIHKKSFSASKKAFIAVVIIFFILIIIFTVLITHNRYRDNKNEITLDNDIGTEEPTTEAITTEETTTEETTTEESVIEESTTEINIEYLSLLESVNGEYLRYDNYIGEWFDEFSSRCFMEITSENNMLHVFMRWNSDYKSSAIWEMNCYYDENSGCIAYTSGKKIIRTYLDAEDYYDEELYSDGSGVFYYKDGALRWIDRKENKGKDCVFIKLK